MKININGYTIKQISENRYEGKFLQEQGCEYLVDDSTGKCTVVVNVWGGGYELTFDNLQDAVTECESWT